MAFMEQYTNAIDQGLESFGAELDKWHTPDWSYRAANGQQAKGTKDAFALLSQSYGALAQFHHEPYYLSCSPVGESGDFEMIGLAQVYVNLHGEEVKNLKDDKGRDWEMSLPGAFKFHYKKDENGPGGFRMQSTEVFSDSGPIVMALLKKGVMTPEQLGLA